MTGGALLLLGALENLVPGTLCPNGIAKPTVILSRPSVMASLTHCPPVRHVPEQHMVPLVRFDVIDHRCCR